ncbi:transcriptional regulator [Synergistales bacterium]|nr:transcriptional regulator [Synergistales bacterium]
MKILKIIFIIFMIVAATACGVAWRLQEVFGFLRTPGVEARLSPVPPSPVSDGGAEVVPNSTEGSDNDPAALNIDPIMGTVNVLLIGLDDVDATRRADTVALAVFDQDTQSVRILSIPRDSRVFIPGRGWDKINHAYVYGGVSLLRETVMNLLGVGINYFVELNFKTFPRMIDLIGGIDIDVEKKLEYTDYSGKLFINIPRGRQHMNGKTALEYVRFRHDPLGDIGRVQRQQKFMAIVTDKLKSPSIIMKIPSLIEEFISAVNTDLTPVESLRLAAFANQLPRERIQLYMAPGKASYIGNLSYWIIDTVETSKWLAGEIVAPEALSAAQEEVQTPLDQESTLELVRQVGKIGVLNGDGAKGVSQRGSQAFQKIGVDVVYSGNARHYDYRFSSVFYPDNANEDDVRSAEALAKLCGITNKSLVQRSRTVTMVSVIIGHDKDNLFERLDGLVF